MPSLAGIIPRRSLGGRAGLSDASSHRSGFELAGTFCLVESGATPSGFGKISHIQTKEFSLGAKQKAHDNLVENESRNLKNI